MALCKMGEQPGKTILKLADDKNHENDRKYKTSFMSKYGGINSTEEFFVVCF